MALAVLPLGVEPVRGGLGFSSQRLLKTVEEGSLDQSGGSSKP